MTLNLEKARELLALRMEQNENFPWRQAEDVGLLIALCQAEIAIRQAEAIERIADRLDEVHS